MLKHLIIAALLTPTAFAGSPQKKAPPDTLKKQLDRRMAAYFAGSGGEAYQHPDRTNSNFVPTPDRVSIPSADDILAGAKRGPSNTPVTREAIDAILNGPTGRTGSDAVSESGSSWTFSGIPPVPYPGYGWKTGSEAGEFFNVVNRVKIPGIPPSPDYKPQYHLLNPTPNSLLRPLSPDRPDATESPLTVDAGRFALEASLFDYRRDGGVETFTYGSLNFKAGLTHNLDFQTIVDVRSGSQGDWDTFGNLTFRLKYNLFGNDHGDSALALMPFVTAPTRDSEWEGGLIIPWSTELTDTIGLGLMAEFDYLHDGDDYNFEFLHTAVLGFSLTEKLGAYTEYIGIASEENYQAYLAGGMNYAINDHLILDFGVQGGLNSDAEDFGFFTGFTKRF